ncbi:hypothetical protein U8335_02640 [Roseiconus lacunae]|uniref:hypothetical protein n=1 Tax=Roseiconus lacunae TaxID=2605694 RepID=UPI0030933C01|nr:hypothetical protein U8335_02640 [Stieleria sp. HD01]
MEVLLGLAFFWAVITLVGHLSWVIVATVVRLIFKPAELLSQVDQTPPFDQSRTVDADVAATHRVISRLAGRAIISPEIAQTWRGHLRQLSRPATHAVSAAQPNVEHGTGQQGPIPQKTSQQSVNPEASDLGLGDGMVSSTRLPTSKPIPTLPHRSVPVAHAASAESFGDAPVIELSEASVPTSSVPVSIKAKAGRSIGEMLADHNIRWGELIAGILIVVCSIGLVVSLWKTIEQMHRVVPSLIFMAGNVSICLAGLYTLFRWKLQSSSRATLVIGLLLVPLGILAGLSTDGIETSTVLLNDPITVAAIVGCGVIYIALIWVVAKALVGRDKALAMTVGIAGTSIVLPFLPAASRTLESGAGWVAIGGSVAVAMMIWLLGRSTPRHRSIGSAGRNAMVVAGTAFSLIVMTAYAAFLMRGTSNGWLALADATLPGFVLLASLSIDLVRHRRRPQLSLATRVFAILFLGGAMVVIVPSMQSMAWLWAWAVSFSMTAIVASLISRKIDWFAVALAPIGIAAVVCSPMLGDLQWETTNLSRKLIGGESMLVATVVAVIHVLALAGLAWRRAVSIQTICRDQPVFAGAAAIWFAYSAVVAALLVVLPEAWMGVVPALSVSLGLFIASIAGVWMLRSTRQLVAATSLTIGATVGFWMSLLKPIQLGQPWPGVMPLIVTLITSTITLLLVGEYWQTRRSRMRSLRLASSGLAVAGAIIGLTAWGVGEPFLIDPSNGVWLATGTTVLSAAVLSLVGFGDRLTALLLASRLSFVSAVSIVCVHFYSPWLFDSEQLRQGHAWWAWSVVIAGTAICFSIRTVFLRWVSSVPLEPGKDAQRSPVSVWLHDRFSWYRPNESAWDWRSEQTSVTVAVSLIGIAALYTYGQLLVESWLTMDARMVDSVGQIDLVLPLVAFGVSAVCLGIRQLGGLADTNERMIGNATGMASLIGWGCVMVAELTLAQHAWQVISATSLMAIVLVVIDGWSATKGRFRWLAVPSGVLTTIGFLFIGVSSAGLLGPYWWTPIAEQGRIDSSVVAMIAVWWAIASLAFASFDHRKPQPLVGVLSGLLVPMIVVLMSPVIRSEPWFDWDGSVWTAQSAGIAGGLSAMVTWAVGLRSRSALRTSVLVCTTIGITNAIAVILSALGLSIAWQGHSVWGMALTAMAVGLWFGVDRIVELKLRLTVPWEVIALLISGHLAYLLAASPIEGISVSLALHITWIVIAGVWTVLWIWTGDRAVSRFGRYQSAVLLVMTTLLCLIQGSARIDALVGWLGSVIAVVLTTRYAFGWQTCDASPAALSRRSTVFCRAFSSYSLTVGTVLTVWLVESWQYSSLVILTWALVWVCAVMLVWRIVVPDRSDVAVSTRPRRLLAEREASLLVLVVVFYEVMLQVQNANFFRDSLAVLDRWAWLRFVIVTLAGTSLVTRCFRRGVIEVGVLTILLGLASTMIRIVPEQSANLPNSLSVIVLGTSLAFAMMAFWSAGTATLLNRLIELQHRWIGREVTSGENRSRLSVQNWADGLIRCGALVVLAQLGICLLLLVGYNAQPVTRITICGIVVMAIAAAELAQRSCVQRLRDVAIGLGFIAIGMWSSTAVADQTLPLWELPARWFVAWVLVAAITGVVIPRFLSKANFDNWQPVIRRAIITASCLALASLLAMLVQEIQIRLAEQTGLLSRPLYLGVAVILGMLTGLATFVAIVSGPGFRYREIWQLSDRQRQVFIVAAQAIGGLTWFHLFLCKSPLASLGLRAYWPYIVMALSFISVAVTEWARRRDDEVLSATLKQTALFLPLIPVLGFWLSGSTMLGFVGESEGGSAWTFIQGHVSYQALLIAAAFYYGVVSVIWKSHRSRLVSIVLANVALWVVLIQVPGWGFLAHPQAWLIPPAVCVLYLVHRYRDELGRETTEAIRYATMLTIYVSSSADMLIQGIGTTIAGPIVLITLALLGAVAGVVLRVRPFLYLGTSFVLLGVTSMVWHAGQQIDAVWPWWVFGIGTGVSLMVGLMALEKNKPQLKQLASTMQQWDT